MIHKVLKACSVFIVFCVLLLPTGGFYIVQSTKLKFHKLQQQQLIAYQNAEHTIYLSNAAFKQLQSLKEIYWNNVWYDIQAVITIPNGVKLKVVADTWETEFKLQLHHCLNTLNAIDISVFADWILKTIYEYKDFLTLQFYLIPQNINKEFHLSILSQGFFANSFQPPEVHNFI